MTVDLSAAASRYTSRSTRAQRVDNSWQENAWGFYADTPEVRFAARWVGNAMGMARLYAGRQLPDGTIQKAPAGHRAAELVASIAGGVEGQSQMLKAFGPHLVVAGEGWIVITPPADMTTFTSGEKPEVGWHVLSVLEMSKKGGGLEAEIDGEITQIPADDPGEPPAQDKPLAIRVWDPSPRRHLEADSPVRSSLGLLAELKLLNMAVSAIARSRLTGRGVLLVPKGTRFPTKAGAEQGEDDLIELFMTVAETAYRDPESAAATVPIILEVPAELLGDIKRLTFESDFDTLAIQLRKECIQRFANGLDVPAEVLLGLGDASHWGAWAITAEAIKMGVEPRLGTVGHALTTQWLQPLLSAEGVADASEWIVWADSAPLRARSNRAETAIKVFELGGISEVALRRETGFDEADAPTAEEKQARQTQVPVPAPDTQPLPVDETEAPPDLLAAAPPGGLQAAADGLIWHALNKAGEKLRRTPACPRSRRSETQQMSASALHTVLAVDADQVTQWGLLDGAFDRAAEIATRYGSDPDCLRTALDTYCRELLAAGQPHVFDYVPAVLSNCATAA